MSKPVVAASGGICPPLAPVSAEKAAAIMAELASHPFQFAPNVTQLAMVALYPEPGEAETIAAFGDTAPDTLHVTMVFLGNVEDIDMKAAAKAVGRTSGSTKPMSGAISGVGVFRGGPDGFPQLAIPGVQGLAALRALLVENLAEGGVVSPSEHDWVPHMTLAYTQEPKLADMDVIGSPVTFNQLSLVVEDVRKDFPLDPDGAADDVHRPERAAATRAEMRRRSMLITQGKELA